MTSMTLTVKYDLIRYNVDINMLFIRNIFTTNDVFITEEMRPCMLDGATILYATPHYEKSPT